jgi:hypothetical protein
MDIRYKIPGDNINKFGSRNAEVGKKQFKIGTPKASVCAFAEPCIKWIGFLKFDNRHSSFAIHLT